MVGIVLCRLASYPDLGSLSGALLSVGPVNGAFPSAMKAEVIEGGLPDQFFVRRGRRRDAYPAILRLTLVQKREHAFGPVYPRYSRYPQGIDGWSSFPQVEGLSKVAHPKVSEGGPPCAFTAAIS